MSRTVEYDGREVGKSHSGKNGDHRGICLVCENNSACIYLQTPQRPVLQCEEFVGDGVTVLRKSWRSPSTASDSMVRFSPNRFRKMQRIV